MATGPGPKICVAVRKKPCTAEDKDVVNCHNPNTLIVNEPKIKYDLTPYTERHNFNFDEVFDERASNRDVYTRCTARLIDTVFNRGNATVFVYGQTGSGKTYTMLGNNNEPGLYMCAAHDIFTRAQQQNYSVFASFYEIYGRKIFDLLNDKAKLVCREDGNNVIQICGLTEHPVARVEELLQIIDSGSQYRAQGQTSANAESSRSHAVLLLELRDNRDQKRVGKISFIDLAGNERGSDTFDSDRKTRIEGAEINKSLLALKECIRALGMGKSHVPFRGSILTEVLRDSFLGNSRTTMIATISPIDKFCEHSLNTLRYTSRVKELGPGGGGGARRSNNNNVLVGNNAAGAAGGGAAGGGGGGGGDQNNAAAGGASKATQQQQQRAAALAERIAHDARGNQPQNQGAAAASSSSNVEPPTSSVPSRISGARQQQQQNQNQQRPPPKQGRRATMPSSSGGGPAAVAGGGGGARQQQNQQNQQQGAKPTWDNDFTSGAALGGAAGGGGRQGNNQNHQPGAHHPRAPLLDPLVQTIVENHINNIDEIEAAEGADSDEEENNNGADGGGENDAIVAGGGAASSSGQQQQQQHVGNQNQQKNELGTSLRKVRAVHAHIVSRIRASEESAILLHRRHIDLKMSMMKEEVRHLQNLDDNSSIDDYVEKVDSLLEREMREIEDMRGRLSRIRDYLREEEVLSKTLTPAGKRQRP